MKLRIRGDSLRLRLKRSEVEQLAAGNSVVETTRFPGAEFCYRLDVVDGDVCAASFDAGTLTVQLPSDAVRNWASGNEVSIHAEQSLARNTLSILVEKDFACLAPGDHREHEDDADTFPHPDAGSGNGC
jgi:hypothetical protein